MHGLKFVAGYSQHFTNKISCAFAPVAKKLSTNQNYTLSTLCGFAHNEDFINRLIPHILDKEYINKNKTNREPHIFKLKNKCSLLTKKSL